MRGSDMQIPSRFTIAVHILTLIAQNKGNETKLTSDLMAGSVGVNPVIIRKTLSQLKKADLIFVQRGSGGATLAMTPEEINLLQVYRAVDSIGPSGQLFSFHDNPNPACPVGRNIHGILDQSLEDVQMAMEKELEKKTLAGILKDTKANWKETGA